MLDLRAYGTRTLDQDGCVTCGDVAVPVRVLELNGSKLKGTEARCEDRTGRQAIIAVDFVPDVQPGDILLVHLGVAITRIEGEER